jgi:hypothetical protein
MKTVKIVLIFVVLAFIFSAPWASMATVVGGGYAWQFLGNTHLEQYEMIVREPLPYKVVINKDGLLVSSVVEAAFALIREVNVTHSEVGRFFLMPQLDCRLSDRIQFFGGIGGGFMGGGIDFTKHDLGGPFFLASKLGARFPLGERWSVEYVYYHQSNAGLYDHNASLNMLQLAFSYTF